MAEIAARWKLGFAPDSWGALGDCLRERGYTAEEIRKSGLVIVKEGSSQFHDRFRNRVMFPICNDYGEVVAFSGRTLGDDPAKYVNSPETPLFTKGRVLFGLEKSKRAILAANEAVVCEGQLDLISAFEAGVQNVTAPQGTAFHGAAGAAFAAIRGVGRALLRFRHGGAQGGGTFIAGTALGRARGARCARAGGRGS